jgi:hypothetical protein
LSKDNQLDISIIDVDSDGKGDLIILDTNGKEVFISLRYVMTIVGVILSSLGGLAAYLW